MVKGKKPATKGEEMQVPLEVSFRGVERTHAMERLISEQAAKLENLCDHIVSVRVSVEKPQEHQRNGNPFRVRAIARIPPGHELVAARDPTERDLHDPLDKVIRETFHALGRQVKEVNERQKREVKRHPEQETQGVVAKLLKNDGYGFIVSPEGQEIYFHRNSVLHHDFDRLVIGAGVRYHEEMGEKGLQASSVELIDKPAGNIARGDGLGRP
jgi:cold shock CspA family protein